MWVMKTSNIMNATVASFSPRLRGLAAGILLSILGAGTCEAQLYPWYIDEIYSNPGGSVQFIELTTQFSPTSLLESGYQFNAWNPDMTQNHFFAEGVSQLSGAGPQFVLYATAGFTQLPGAITPDYIMPSGFLFAPGGKLSVETLVGGLGSTLTYTDLPTDGIHALNASGQVVPFIAENFAGQIYEAPEPSVTAMLLAGFGLICFFLRNRSAARLNGPHAGRQPA